MIKVLAQAIEKARVLSADQQAYAAHLLEQLAAAASLPYRLSDEERAVVQEGIADLDAGRVVSDADMASFWARQSSRPY